MAMGEAAGTAAAMAALADAEAAIAVLKERTAASLTTLDEALPGFAAVFAGASA